MKEQSTHGMALSRRAFIGHGASAFMVAAGMGHLAFGATGQERLRFGVLSDIHITRGKDTGYFFEKALKFFRDHRVDAVLIAGDMADSGLDSQLQIMGDTWRRVFPGNRLPDGGHVEKIFVTGNHDVKGLADGARAFDFQVTVEAEDVDREKIWMTKRVYSPHYYWAAEKDDDTVSCVFACAELPAPNKVVVERGRRFRFAVSPANCFGAHGKPVRSAWLTGGFGMGKDGK